MWIQSYHHNTQEDKQRAIEQFHCARSHQYTDSIYPNVLKENNPQIKAIYYCNNNNDNNNPCDVSLSRSFIRTPYSPCNNNNLMNTSEFTPSTMISSVIPDCCISIPTRMMTNDQSSLSIIPIRNESHLYVNNTDSNDGIQQRNNKGDDYNPLLHSYQYHDLVQGHSIQWDILMNNSSVLLDNITSATANTEIINKSSHQNNDHFYELSDQQYTDSKSINSYHFNQHDTLIEKINSNYSEASSSLCDFQFTEVQEKDIPINSNHNHLLESYENICQKPHYYHDNQSQNNQHNDNINQTFNHNWSIPDSMQNIMMNYEFIRSQRNTSDQNKTESNHENYFQSSRNTDNTLKGIDKFETLDQNILTENSDTNFCPAITSSSSLSSSFTLSSKFLTPTTQDGMKKTEKSFSTEQNCDRSNIESLDYYKVEDDHLSSIEISSKNISGRITRSTKRSKHSTQSRQMKRMNEFRKTRQSIQQQLQQVTMTSTLSTSTPSLILSTTSFDIPSSSTNDTVKFKQFPVKITKINHDMLNNSDYIPYNVNIYHTNSRQMNNVTLKQEQNIWNNEYTNYWIPMNTNNCSPLSSHHQPVYEQYQRNHYNINNPISITQSTINNMFMQPTTSTCQQNLPQHVCESSTYSVGSGKVSSFSQEGEEELTDQKDFGRDDNHPTKQMNGIQFSTETPVQCEKELNTKNQYCYITRSPSMSVTKGITLSGVVNIQQQQQQQQVLIIHIHVIQHYQVYHQLQ
ncbi:unnamed protein product [Heterobilharzia americana]|nr:unnamed protein product [Heterobilharzia americana]